MRKNEEDKYRLIKIALSTNLEDFLKDIPEDDNPAQLIKGYVEKSQMTISQIAQKADIDENYCGKILNGKRKNPSRDYLILIGVALDLHIEQLNYVLKKYGKAELEPNNSKRDAIIFYGIVNKKDKKEINFDLDREKQEPFK